MKKKAKTYLRPSALQITLLSLSALSVMLIGARAQNQRDSSWTSTGNLVTGRYLHTATLLPSGKVLVTGGFGDSGILNGAELYDPAVGTWTATSNLATARYGHSATLLASGKVLIAAGIGNNVGDLRSAELYDPTRGIWRTTGRLATAR